MTYRIGLEQHRICYIGYEGVSWRCLDFLRYARYTTNPKIPKSTYGRISIIRMPWAKLVATNRPSADDSRAARHIAQPCAKVEGSTMPTRDIEEITANSLRISAHPNQVCCVTQSFWKCKSEQDHCQNQWCKS